MRHSVALVMSPSERYTTIHEVLLTVARLTEEGEEISFTDVADETGASEHSVMQHCRNLKARGLLVYAGAPDSPLWLTTAGYNHLRQLNSARVFAGKEAWRIPSPPPSNVPRPSVDDPDSWVDVGFHSHAPGDDLDGPRPAPAEALPTHTRSVDVYALKGSRESRRAAFKAASRPVTLNIRRMSAAELESTSEPGTDDLPPFPKTRGDCVEGPRPCIWARCRHHLAIEVSHVGNIKFSFPDVFVEDMPPARSCSLDIADSGPQPLEEVGLLLGITRERVRQLEGLALAKIKGVRQVKGGVDLASIKHFKRFMEENKPE